MLLSTNIAAMTSTTLCVNIAETTLTVVTNLDKENKLNHMTDSMKGFTRLAAGKVNLRPLSLEVF